MDEPSTSTNEYGRRTWNLAHYTRKDSEDEDAKKDKEEGPKPKAALKPREEKVDLESKLGKTVVINKATPSSQAGGFFCEVCDCLVKDSINYLDHINGKKHQRNLGFSMKVQKSTLDDVEKRFQESLKKQEKPKEEYNMEERLKELREEEEKLKEYRKEKKKEKKKKRRQEEEEQDEVGDDDIARLMGFSSFSSSSNKKSKH